MIRPPPRTTRTDTTLSLHDALPIYNDDNYFKQPGDLFRLMTPAQQQALFANTARAMGDAPDFIKQRHVGNCTKADPAYGAGVEAALRKLGAFDGTTSANSLGEHAHHVPAWRRSTRALGDRPHPLSRVRLTT